MLQNYKKQFISSACLLENKRYASILKRSAVFVPIRVNVPYNNHFL
jgi:hypothetical protein